MNNDHQNFDLNPNGGNNFNHESQIMVGFNIIIFNGHCLFNSHDLGVSRSS